MDDELAAVEQDPRFPSGAWTGSLQYWLPGRHNTDLRMTCRDGELTGIGQDWSALTRSAALTTWLRDSASGPNDTGASTRFPIAA